jgi:hypothetical protein
MLLLLVNANVPISLILVTLIMTIISSETDVHTRVTRRNIPEDCSFHSHRREDIKSYIALTDWVL